MHRLGTRRSRDAQPLTVLERRRDDPNRGDRLTVTRTHGNAIRMSDQPQSQKTWGGRFRGAASDLMTRINASISFDKRLWREDIEASKAHASMLRDRGIIGSADAAAILGGLDQIAGEFEQDG